MAWQDVRSFYEEEDVEDPRPVAFRVDGAWPEWARAPLVHLIRVRCSGGGGVMATRVVSLRTGEPYDVRIDRRTPWGNPFRLRFEEDRDLVVQKFQVWVENSAEPKARWIREHVHELRGKRLACWCAPLRCHGDVLAAMAEDAWAGTLLPPAPPTLLADQEGQRG